MPLLMDKQAGVLTFSLPNKAGTYVINKQPPTRQIWLSSPKSGPIQFRYEEDGEWVDIRGSGKSLRSLLKEELGVDLPLHKDSPI